MLRNFSYIIEGKLAGCAHPMASPDPDEALERLRDMGIGAIISLDEEGIPTYLIADHDLHHMHLPIPDFGCPTMAQARQMVAFVEMQHSQNRAVCLHCYGGYGRTGTMLACILVWLGHEPSKAIQHVRTLRPGSIETPEQESFVHEFAQLALSSAESTKVRPRPKHDRHRSE